MKFVSSDIEKRLTDKPISGNIKESTASDERKVRKQMTARETANAAYKVLAAAREKFDAIEAALISGGKWTSPELVQAQAEMEAANEVYTAANEADNTNVIAEFLAQ